MCCVSWKRYVGWTLFLSLLIGLGVGIYRLQPHEPRWTAASIPSNSLVQFSADGNRLTTTNRPPRIWNRIIGGRNGVLLLNEVSHAEHTACVWNVESGAMILRFPTAGDFSAACAFSKNRRHVTYTFNRAAPKDDAGKPALQLANLETGEIHDIPLPRNETPMYPDISDCSKYLMVRFTDDQHKSSRIRVYDAVTGRLIADRPSLGCLSCRCIAANCLMHLVPGEDGTEIEIWSLTEGKVVGRLDHTDGTAYLSPDERFLLCERQAPPDEKRGPWRVWNLRTRKPQAEFPLDFGVSDVVFSPNGEIAAMCGSPWAFTLELRRLATGERLAHLNQPPLGRTVAFSPDGQLLIAADAAIHPMIGHAVPITGLPMRGQAAPITGLRVFDAATWKQLWNDGQNQASTCVFTPDSKRILQKLDFANDVRVLDSATGAQLRTIELPPNQSARSPVLTPDGRYFVTHRNRSDLDWAFLVNGDPWWKKAIRWTGVDPERFSSANRDHAVVYDLENDRECLRLVGWNVSDALLSDDGNTLVTLHEEEDGRVMRCWDVHAWKLPWWAVGMPIGLGVGLIVVAKGWARWRKRKIATPQKAS